MNSSTIDVQDFRRALGQFPTGVTIVTTKTTDGDPIGVTASSFNSVSIDPPLVLWSVDKGAYSASIFSDATHFAVNILGKDQVDLSNRFASRGEDKFSQVSWQEGAGGSPVFDGCAARFECKTWNVYEGGDHFIIVGEVLDYQHSESSAPLVFSRGSYAVSMQHPSSMQQSQVKVQEDGFLPNYLLYLLRMAFANYTADFYPKLVEQFDITPEEWRVFTALADHDSMEGGELAALVMQPAEVFKATAEYMENAGHIVHDKGEDKISLTAAGKDLGAKLNAFARQHESGVLGTLEEGRAAALKADLREVLSQLT